jgi:divalent metal cation (Fe/Co/Zn/Cd) transporter
VHVLVPGNWTVKQGQQVLEQIEREIHSALPNTTVLTHLESLDERASWEDQSLEREGKPLR